MTDDDYENKIVALWRGSAVPPERAGVDELDLRKRLFAMEQLQARGPRNGSLRAHVEHVAEIIAAVATLHDCLTRRLVNKESYDRREAIAVLCARQAALEERLKKLDGLDAAEGAMAPTAPSPGLGLNALRGALDLAIHDAAKRNRLV